MQPVMGFSDSVPGDVTAIIHELTKACSNWPLVPVASISTKLDDTIIAAKNICHTVSSTGSPGSFDYSFVIIFGVSLVFFGWMLSSFLRGAYEVARDLWKTRSARI